MEDNDTRNMLLNELIDKMHTRLADKEYPDAVIEPKAEEEIEGAPVEGVEIEAKAEPKAEDVEGDDMSDADIDEILKSC